MDYVKGWQVFASWVLMLLMLVFILITTTILSARIDNAKDRIHNLQVQQNQTHVIVDQLVNEHQRLTTCIITSDTVAQVRICNATS